ncbi:MAG: hypothetical protein QOD58_3616 [Mycobacterium sp.]|jgi:hypothetical protein|nr:hypothetical protein [Mycobacterium sp.]
MPPVTLDRKPSGVFALPATRFRDGQHPRTDRSDKVSLPPDAPHRVNEPSRDQ